MSGPKFDRPTQASLRAVEYPVDRYESFIGGLTGKHSDSNINILRAIEDTVAALNNETSDGNLVQGLAILSLYSKEEIKTALTSEPGKKYLRLNAACLTQMLANPQDIAPVASSILGSTKKYQNLFRGLNHLSSAQADKPNRLEALTALAEMTVSAQDMLPKDAQKQIQQIPEQDLKPLIKVGLSVITDKQNATPLTMLATKSMQPKPSVNDILSTLKANPISLEKTAPLIQATETQVALKSLVTSEPVYTQISQALDKALPRADGTGETVDRARVFDIQGIASNITTIA